MPLSWVVFVLATDLAQAKGGHPHEHGGHSHKHHGEHISLPGASADTHLAPVGNHGEPTPPGTPHDNAKPIVETGGWGFSYGPLPIMKPGRFPNDDMMTEAMRAQWGVGGRQDLATISKMGANMIRLYGNDPRFDGSTFLKVANSWGLKVVVGLSDYPFSQQEGNCFANNLECYQVVKDSYTTCLDDKGHMPHGHKGFLTHNKKYHAALDTLILLNEPDLKIVVNGGPKKNYMKAILSAFDGVLAAEQAKGLDITSKDNIKITTTFSYGTCPLCPNIMKLKSLGCCIPCFGPLEPGEPKCSSLGAAGKEQSQGGMRCPKVRKPFHEDDCPALPMIMDLHAAMENPSSVGYAFKTVGWKEAFTNRWVHTLNVPVGAESFKQQFLDKYLQLPFNQGKSADNMIQVLLGEYGDPHLARNPVALESDLKEMITLVKDKTYPFVGFNYFQYMVAMWKSCDNPKGWDEWVAKAYDNSASIEYDNTLGCGERLFGTFAAGDITVSRTGGIDYDSNNVYDVKCIKPLFKGKPEAIASAFGGKAPDTSVCEAGWQANPKKYCVASRGDKQTIGNGVAWVCAELGTKGLDCTAKKPKHCENEYHKADWAFSMYFELHKEEKIKAGVLEEDICNFDGAGVLTAIPADPQCVLTSQPGPPGTPVPGEGGGGGGGGGAWFFIVIVVAAVPAGYLGWKKYKVKRARDIERRLNEMELRT